MLKRIKQNGLRYTFAIAFNRIVPQWLFRCRRYVVYQLSTQSLSGNPEVAVGWCESDADFQAVEQVTYFQRESCLGEAKACQAELDGKVAGGFWATTVQFEESELGVRYELSPKQAWLFAARVDPQFRRAGVYASILSFIIPALAQQGLTHQLVAVNPDNLGSNQAHLARSFRTPGKILAIRFLKTTVCFCSGEIKCDRWISMNSNKRPILIEIESIDEPA